MYLHLNFDFVTCVVSEKQTFKIERKKKNTTMGFFSCFCSYYGVNFFWTYFELIFCIWTYFVINFDVN